jgi:hypothetical protein
MAPAHAGLDYSPLPGDYQTVAHRSVDQDGGLFGIFRDMLGRARERNADELDQFFDDFEDPTPRQRRQRISEELRKQRERR